jgi:DNA-binding NarL/FixJ family response regulator
MTLITFRSQAKSSSRLQNGATMQIQLLIGSRDHVLAQSIRNGLELEDPTGIASEISPLHDLSARAAMLKPDVALIEVEQDTENSWNALGRVRCLSPRTHTLMMCDSCTQAVVLEAIKQGASGCLCRSAESWLLAKAVHSVHAGETWFGRTELLKALQLQIGIVPLTPIQTDDRLTRREEEILHLIGAGLSNKEIGRRLDISDKTVKTHLHRIYVKLNRSGRYKAYLSQPDPRGAMGWMSAAK